MHVPLCMEITWGLEERLILVLVTLPSFYRSQQSKKGQINQIQIVCKMSHWVNEVLVTLKILIFKVIVKYVTFLPNRMKDCIPGINISHT